MKPKKGNMEGEIKRRRRIKGDLAAQSLIEAALVLPLLLLLILGAMDFGRMFYAKMVLTNAAREGANYLAYNPEDANAGYPETLIAIQEEASSSNVEVLAGDITYVDCCTRGLPVEVSITQSIDLIYDGILQALGVIGGPVQITGTVRMMVQ